MDGVKVIYEWKGAIQEESESMLIVKSDASRTTELTRFIESKHPYEYPEIVTLKVS